MSQVISFRLDPDNPRESSALTILTCWMSKGYSIRQVLIEALLQMQDIKSPSANQKDLQALKEEIERLISLLERVNQGSEQVQDYHTRNIDPLGLISDKFAMSIKQNIKPGLRVDKGDKTLL